MASRSAESESRATGFIRSIASRRTTIRRWKRSSRFTRRRGSSHRHSSGATIFSSRAFACRSQTPRPADRLRLYRLEAFRVSSHPWCKPRLPSDFVPGSLGGVNGQYSSRFPVVAGSALTAAEVQQILAAAVALANRVRAGIRQPLGSNARVTIAVVDTDGDVLGIFRQLDAPVFGLDVSVQKARTSNFFARTDAGSKITAAGFGSYVTRASADGLGLNGSIAFSDRAIGFLHRPFFPDGINNSLAGPFSTPLADWSPFNDGLQLDLSPHRDSCHRR